jgi:hypothetical protein
VGLSNSFDSGVPFSSPAAVGLVSRTPGATTAVEAITVHAANLLRKAGLSQPPFRPQVYADLRKVRQIVYRKLKVDGRLIPKSDGFLMELRKDRPVTRQNFTCAHELAHTFFYELVPSVKYRNQSDPPPHDPEEERLCDIAAAELLMPNHTFRKVVDGFESSPKSICEIAATFETSIISTAIRMAHLNLWNVSFILWKSQDGQFRPIWLAKRNGTFRYPKLQILNPKSSSVCHSLAADTETSASEYLITEQGTWPCYIQSLPLTSHMVLSLVSRGRTEKSPESVSRQRCLPRTYLCNCDGSGWQERRIDGYRTVRRCLAQTHVLAERNLRSHSSIKLA